MAPDEWSTETVPLDISLDGSEIIQVYRHEPTHDTELLSDEIWNKLTAGAVPDSYAMANIAAANDAGVPFAEIVQNHILPMWQAEEEQNDA